MFSQKKASTTDKRFSNKLRHASDLNVKEHRLSVTRPNTVVTRTCRIDVQKTGQSTMKTSARMAITEIIIPGSHLVQRFDASMGGITHPPVSIQP